MQSIVVLIVKWFALALWSTPGEGCEAFQTGVSVAHVFTFTPIWKDDPDWLICFIMFYVLFTNKHGWKFLIVYFSIVGGWCKYLFFCGSYILILDIILYEMNKADFQVAMILECCKFPKLTPRDINTEPTNHPLEKENQMNQTSMTLGLSR